MRTERIKAQNLATAIAQLPRNVAYQYINPKNRGQIEIVHVQLPEGPIKIKRCNPSRGESFASVAEDSISSEMLWRVANALNQNVPLNIDRVLGASYNTRSVLESLLAHTPQFRVCYPGRIETNNSTTRVKKGHKHLLWTPDKPHPVGEIAMANTEVVISEIPSQDVIYEALTLPNPHEEGGFDIEVKRRHAQIQIALVKIGLQLGYRTWVARNDQGIIYENKRLGEHDGVISSLEDENLVRSYEDARRAALLIDCIWFKNGRFMPAVMEVEHTTGVTSGLSRMKNFKDKFPPFPTRWVVIAPDEDRAKVVSEANKSQFKDLDTRFFPFSAVEELLSLCKRRKIAGVSAEFLDSFMERVVD